MQVKVGLAPLIECQFNNVTVAKGLLNWRNILVLELDRLTTRHSKGDCLEDRF